MQWDWLSFAFYVLCFSIFMGGLRLLNSIVTTTRSRLGLAAAWCVAILGAAIILCGVGIVTMTKVTLS